MNESSLDVWKKRIAAAKDTRDKWEADNRVRECYSYYKGEQLVERFDEFGNRRAQINKIHPEVRNNLPSLYYYRPFLRLTAAPEMTDEPGTEIAADTQLLQDTVNHLVRDPKTMFRASTFLALKEAHWSMGIVEVGYDANFVDVPGAEKPPLKEKEETPTEANAKEQGVEVPAEVGKDALGLSVDAGSDDASILAEVSKLKGSLASERFFVKHIPAKRVLVSISNMPILENNDWIGYYEDVPLEDVKRATAYENTVNLTPNTGDPDRSDDDWNEATGSTDRVRLYKIWDLRTKQKLVYAEGHDQWLMRKSYARCPLKFLRFDIDPYEFRPRPLILSKLGPQDEYNQSREFMRKERISRVARYTYDEDGIDKAELQKLESGVGGVYVPRKGGSAENVIAPIAQPTMTEGAIQSITLSDKEFSDVGGVGGDARVASTKTATQARIAETKNQVQDSFDRLVVAEWLADIGRELLALAIENMNLDQIVAINMAPDSQFAPQIGQKISQQFARINAEKLGKASEGIAWDVIIDLESLSPVSEEEKFQKWMQGLSLFGNPPMARLFSVSPELLRHTLDLLGIKVAQDQMLILEAMQKVVQMEQMLAAAGQNAAPGVSPQGGATKPGNPAGGPQPGAPGAPQPPQPPTGPGASPMKM